MVPQPERVDRPRPKLGAIVALFARYANTTFGGGSATIAVLVEDQFAAFERVETRTTTYASRALIGWSWLIGGHGFISIAGGISVGRESGSETTTSTVGRMPLTHDVTRTGVGGEGFLRIGGAFDL